MRQQKSTVLSRGRLCSQETLKKKKKTLADKQQNGQHSKWQTSSRTLILLPSDRPEADERQKYCHIRKCSHLPVTQCNEKAKSGHLAVLAFTGECRFGEFGFQAVRLRHSNPRLYGAMINTRGSCLPADDLLRGPEEAAPPE